MSIARRAFAWMFAAQQLPVNWRRVILWWEIRRIPYNGLVAVWGAFCVVIFFWSLSTSGHLEPGEDAVEPLALIFAPIGVNLCYTLGWLVEILARIVNPSLSGRFGSNLLKAGIGISAALISLPAVIWGGYRLLQLVHILR